MSSQPLTPGGKCVPCESVRGVLRTIYPPIRRVYAYLFCRRSLSALNNVLLDLALSARGFNNCCDPMVSGEAAFITSVSRSGLVNCVDIGANIGDYTQALLSAASGKVISVEPNPTVFRRLEERFASHSHRVIPLQYGIGSVPGVLDLYLSESDSTLATFSSEVNQIGYVGSKNTSSASVEVVTLDWLVLESGKIELDSIDLIKIDTEGYEYEVLLGAQRVIGHYRPKYIQLEYNLHQLYRGHSLLSISRLLPDYVPHQIVSASNPLLRRDAGDPLSNVFQYSNFVFLRRDLV